MHRKYDDKIPNFLRNRLKGVVQHIMKRCHPQKPSNYIRRCGNSLSKVEIESTNQQYQVWLGSQGYQVVSVSTTRKQDAMQAYMWSG